MKLGMPEMPISPPISPAGPVAGGEEPAATEASPFERLLVPVDFSSASRAALAMAMRIADRWGSEVVLFHAAGFDQNDEFLRYTGVPWGREDVVRETNEHLRRFADEVAPGTTARVRFDAASDENAVHAVVAACARHSPSLVVLGAHPRDRRRILRSRCERIVRAIACPVVLVHGEPEPVVDPDM
jgi:nucleotide-binding universal stress UspA family protein